MTRADYATGKPINSSKPEEIVRQEYERVLVENYGYRKSEIDIGVRIPRGAGFYADEADIVVYKSPDGRDPTSDILGIIETKRQDRNDGIAQLKSYMTATSAEWGVWTNGDDIAYVCRLPGQLAILEDYLHNLPARGQSIQEVGRIKKDSLRPFGRQELKAAFRRILRTLYANTNISRREKLGSEMIKLIFAKIEDERSYLASVPEFRAESGEDPEAVKRRVVGLFERVRDDLERDGVFTQEDSITLDARSLAWVVGQLELGSLLDTDADVVGDAFEVFAESKLVGEKGEFFTPRGVVQLAIKLADPKPNDTICDPACGSGGFLIYGMKHIWAIMDEDPRWKDSPQLIQQKQRVAASTVYGIDKEIDLVKIAKAYMAIAGDGRSNIVHENSLHKPDEFNAIAKQTFVENNFQFKKFDFVLTNPPYGTKTRVLKSDSAQFHLGHKLSKDKKTGQWFAKDAVERDPYVLFIERCLDMLKDGGTLAIVLPETVFHAPSLEYIRDFITGRGSIEAVIDLPHNTFRPHCNAKTNLLIVRKGVLQTRDVVLSVPEEMGHDHQGRTLIRLGSDEIWDDLAVVHSELDDPSSSENRFTFSAPWSLIHSKGNWIPQYYKSLISPSSLPPGRIGVTLGNLVDQQILGAWDGHGSPRSVDKGRGDIPYIRVKDVVNWELYRDPTSMVPDDVFNRFTKNKQTAREGDVIFVRRGSYRIGTVAMASRWDDRVLMTRELLTLRIMVPENEWNLTPYYLLGLLSSEFVQSQIESKVFIDTTLPNIGDRWRDLILPIHEDTDERLLVSTRVEAAMRNKWRAKEEIYDLEKLFGEVVT